MRAVLLSLLCVPLLAVVLGTVRGVVHDPDHRPIPDARVTVKSANSDFSQSVTTGADGSFEISVPVGAYTLTVEREGFATAEQKTVVASSGGTAVLHFQLSLGQVEQTVTVSENSPALDPERMTPTTVISRAEIQTTPGADLSNSLNMITDYVPGAWVTHDQLHIRGGHQVSWAIDGVPIPNTNIASNVGPQVDPKDVDYLEAQRGGYSAAYGDRTYGVFNVVPRTGFERNNDAEVYSTFGTFFQTNDQINLGGHTQKFAYFASVNGNRSDYGLQTPGPDVLHDRVWGVGGSGTLIYNRDAQNQFRFVTSLRGDNYQIPNDPDAQAAGIRDVEREQDFIANFSWVHVFRPGWVLTASPFYHGNIANYDSNANDTPLATTQHRNSQYGGAQITFNASTAKHNATVGLYGFGQHDDTFAGLIANGGSGLSFAQRQVNTGQLVAAFFEDQYRPVSWLTLIAGVRLTHFAGIVSENGADPRLGGSILIPHLNWVFRGFWGRYYQAPPLSTVSGPVADFAVSQGFDFIPLRGERDEEHQFGLTIPVRGWSVDVNNYHLRAHNYFDHQAIGNSNIFYPLTIDQARLYGWEVTVRSPSILHRGNVYLAYAYAHAEGAGAVTGGLTDFSAPPSGYFPLDHDQRDTLHVGFNFNLPRGFFTGGNLYYGSGFTDGASPTHAHLEPHTTFDLTIGKSIMERLTISATALNLTNRRFLLDNSQTFGGTHYADPRLVYLQVRYRFHY
ncbi:MAG: TonB-dependent receptor [Bryobacterales bacterium]|nr:TonB-dependent receptor [Bryobacterales bacterium]MBV9398979.1 TonB-dependent receptor [Bryobacterales bacterium]